MEKGATLSSYIAAALTSAFGALTLQDAALWVGIVTAIGTFLVNWYYKAREARRMEHMNV